MNKITNRLKTIFSHLPNCNHFADIGCDHGYISYLMLEEKKCRKLTYSDVSSGSLQKARQLLAGRDNAKGVLCDGLEKIDKSVDCVLIAGMGGENVISILQNGFFPQTLVLQPMKNVDKLRVYLNKNGYYLQKDFIFFAEDKFYNLIVATRGSETLTEEQIEYGKDNLSNPTEDFLNYLQREINKKQEILQGLSQEKQLAYKKLLQRDIEVFNRLKG